MSTNNTDDTTDEHETEPNNNRRRLLQVLGIGGASLALGSSNAAAHPHGPHRSASGKSEVSDEDMEDDEDDERGNGHGYGQWCQGVGFGRGINRGEGYRRRFPHNEDETEWDDWQPGQGAPPWADEDEDDEDEAEDGDGDEDDDDDDDDDADSGEDEEPVTLYDLNVIVAGPDGVPTSDVEITVEGNEESITATTDDNGFVSFDVANGDYDLSVNEESTEHTTPEDSSVTIEDGDATVTIELAASDADSVAADAQVDDGDEDDSEDDAEDTTEGTEDGTEEPPEEPEANPDAETDAEETDVAETIETRIHEATNAYREAQDVPTVELNEDVAEVAREHSEDMSEEGYFEHVAPDGTTPNDRLDEAEVEYTGWAENIAWESAEALHDPEGDAESLANSVVEGWINSPGHRENLIGNYDSQGIGVYADNEAGEVFFTQLLIATPEEPEGDSEDTAEDTADDTSDDADDSA